jgi:hypothetical protein
MKEIICVACEGTGTILVDDLHADILEGKSTLEQDREFLIKEGFDPDELAEQGVVFVKTLMDKINLEKRVEELTKVNEELKEALQPFINLAHAVLDDNDFKHDRTLYEFDECGIKYSHLRKILKHSKK